MHGKLAQRLAAAAVFTAISLAFLAAQFASPSLTSQDDGYYHIRHSLSYCAGAPAPAFPVFSVLSERTTDLYFGYHAVMCPFVALAPGEGPESWIVGAKIFNAALFTILMAAFFLTLRRFLAGRGWMAGRSAHRYALAATALLAFATPQFLLRFVFTRPHALASLAFLLVSHFTLRRKHRLTFLVSAALPLAYSVSFIVLIPPAVFLAASLAREGRKADWRRDSKPLGAAALGLALGIALHPDPASYLYVGYFMHVLTVANSLFSSAVVEPVELGGAVWSAADLLWLAPLAAALALELRDIVRARGLKSLPHDRLYLLMGSLACFAGFIVVQRFAEYMFFFIVPFAFDSLGSRLSAARGGAGDGLLASLRDGLLARSKLLAAALAAIVIIGSAALYGKLALALSKQPPLDDYRGAAEYLIERSRPGDVVFLQFVEQYARLVFWNGSNRYTIGQEPTFTYSFDRRAHWLQTHISNGGPICGEPACPEPGMSLEEGLDALGARYVFVDRKLVYPGRSANPLAERLDRDPAFEEAYADAERGTSVFKAKEAGVPRYNEGN